MTLDARTVDQIQQRLAFGETQRSIALATGVSRGSVATIANGRRISQPGRPSGTNALRGPIERCPGCGRRIEMPCRACLGEARNQRDRWTKSNAPKPK
jgi:hypothetical protein